MSGESIIAALLAAALLAYLTYTLLRPEHF